MQIDWTYIFETDNDLLRQKVLNWFADQGDDARIYENRVIADEQSFSVTFPTRTMSRFL